MDTYKTIHQLKELLDEGIISQEEYDEKRKEILFPEEFEEEKRRKQKEQAEREVIDANNAVLYDAALKNISCKDAQSYRDAISILKKIGDWKDVPSLLEQCEKELPELEKQEEVEKAERAKKEVYDNAIIKLGKQTTASHNEAIKELETLGNWGDALEVIEKSKIELPEIERKEAEARREASKKAKAKKYVLIVSVIAAVFIALLIFMMITVIIPKQKYNKAMSMLESGDYENAYTLLEELGETDAIKENKHDRGLKLLESGDYENAYVLLEESGDYETIQESKYNRAIDYINSGDVENAYVLLDGLDYKDSSEKAASIEPQYNKIVLSRATVGSTFFLGSYEQDNNTSNGKEDVEWIVLDKKGSSLLLISKYALVSMLYNDEKGDVTWEKCALRKWLNGAFVNDTFNTGEQKLIVNSTVTADINPEYDTPPGDETKDKVFLLSIAEANKYFDSDDARKCQGTACCMEQYSYTSDGNCVWWLRSPGESSGQAAYVDNNGYVSISGASVGYGGGYGIRPALRVDFGD